MQISVLTLFLDFITNSFPRSGLHKDCQRGHAHTEPVSLWAWPYSVSTEIINAVLMED